MTTTGLTITQKKKRIEVDSKKYNDDLNYQDSYKWNQFRQTLYNICKPN